VDTECGPELRSVSGTELMEGAPLLVETEETEVLCAAEGMMRRDCGVWVSWGDKGGAGEGSTMMKVVMG